MHGVRQWWVRLSILHKAIVLSCAFVIPILLVVGLLMNDFYDYREKSDDILSEYARCTDYMNAMEQENALLGELTFAAPESDTIDKYADAVQDTAAAWERLRSAETDGSTQSEVLKQVIDRTMKSYRVRQETFIAQLHDGTFDAVNYEALRTQGSYLTQYTDQLTAAFLMEGREGYLVLGQRGTSQNMVFTIVAAIGSVLFAGAMLYYARSLLLPVQQMSRGARRVADGEYDIEDFNFARSDEIGMLADSFNHLKHQIARTIHALESEAQLEKSLRQQESEAARLRQLIEQSRFAQLQSQINPHFLFNTLQSVANMAGIEQATVTGDMVVRLANFFRYTLDHDDSVVTLDRELALLRDYISLQELRFGERISFEMNCDSRCAACELPKFTLQPIVENSIVHGMRSRSAGGRIRIVTESTPNGCRIQITDNRRRLPAQQNETEPRRGTPVHRPAEYRGTHCAVRRQLPHCQLSRIGHDSPHHTAHERGRAYMLKVLIAEDEPLSLQNLSGQMRDLLGADALIEGVANGREAGERARQIQPQLVLMDIEMPVMNGLDAAAIIHKAMPETHIVFLTAFDRFDYAVGAMRAGGTDYLVKPFDSAQITACLRKLNLLPESRPAVRGDKQGNTFCTQFSVWLEHHYMQDVSLDQAAEAMGMSSFYFSRFFRTSYNQTFLEYLTAYRIDRAVELLQQTDIPVREIAVRVGYTDANYFTKVFKRHLGVTPTEYRNHNAN